MDTHMHTYSDTVSALITSESTEVEKLQERSETPATTLIELSSQDWPVLHDNRSSEIHLWGAMSLIYLR